MKITAALLVPFSLIVLTACSVDQPVEPVRIFPDAPEPTPFTRAYSMTEAPDGIRVFVQEDGDQTLMYFVEREGAGWSEPVEVDLPHRGMLTGPHFSRFDDAFYFSSNAAYPGREGANDLNIWRAAYLGQGRFDEPEPLPMPQINTGANEIGTATTEDGLLLFVTNHSRSGSGGYDVMQARLNSEGEWASETMPEGFNDRLADDHIAMDPLGRWVIFYSHRQPKFGGVDLWISERDSEASWQVPVNLGSFINTAGIEFGAGLSWDNETFFFSRDGALFEVPIA
ncbi:MAG: hypothetical protein AAGG45_10420, partial [Pseudomonadota bacterium]